MSILASLPSQLELDSIDITSVRLSADEESQSSTLCESTNTDSTKVSTDECSIPTSKLDLAKKPVLAKRRRLHVSLKHAAQSFGSSLQNASCDIG
jgi:hypothetical protein